MAMVADISELEGRILTSMNDKHHAVRARVGRPQQVAAASASTHRMPASSTATPLQASVASSSDTQDIFLAQAQALVNMLAVNSEVSMIKQAQASDIDGFVVGW